jgi:hypothetical protein
MELNNCHRPIGMNSMLKIVQRGCMGNAQQKNRSAIALRFFCNSILLD